MKNASPDLPIVMTVASWTTNVVYPDAAGSGMIHLALGSAAVNRSLSTDHLIRFTPGVEQESPVLASYLKRFNRIAVVGGENDYSSEYGKALESLLGEKIVLESRYDQNDVSASLNINAILDSDPDVVVLLSVSEGGTVAELLRNGGITARLAGTRVIERNSLTETEAAEGLVFTTPELNRSHPFFARYREIYGEDATFYGAEGFDALTTLSAAVSACGSDNDCMYSWYQNLSYDGALGSVAFDQRGTASYPIGFNIVNDGKFEEYRF
jgi:ABC-type branched-subunit amino acid transport system substrate-binding protein